ncbi:diaminopimelate decarboxylase [Nevskia ramosa]|uniref:diaminopimelate decarboxylase n=1 Tax=Nevskia ramosa TaxID=64002 RepID=UPI00235324E6|nr:diaminopimelate decarboxylase [Nevskia ramosa]
MDSFEYRDGALRAEAVPLSAIAAAHGTPTYVYSRAALERHYRAFDEALNGVEHRVCYAVKANSNLAVLQVLARLGAGFDIVSGGELQRVLKAGGDPAKVVFSGVGKTASEIELALTVGIYCFNVESEVELHRLSALATKQGKTARIAFRVNPDVDAKTHPYISTGLKENKFGVDIAEGERLYQLAATLPGIAIDGVACHIGSQLLELSPFLDALDRVLALIDRLAERGIVLHHIDVGGGLGVRYDDEVPPTPLQWAAAIKPKLAGRKLVVMTEPGRAIAGNAGVLLTRVELLKPGAHKNFAIIDAAMNDLIRPSFYDAWHAVIPVAQHSDAEAKTWDLVGPVCETGDWLARDRELALTEGDLLAFRTAGAYGFTMSSNYNSRGRAAEVLVDGDTMHLARARESFDDLVQNETLLP